MKKSFTLNQKPFSVNAMYYASVKAKTKEARQWSYQVFNELDSPQIQQCINDLKGHFNPKKHCYKIKMTAYFPEDVIYKKDGSLSSRAFDITNWEKPIVDLLFLPKHCKSETPYGVNNLEIDDRFITKCVSEKKASKTGHHYIDFVICITEVCQ